ncbi:MAG TPA: hypothetical protein VHZ28_01935 [Terracidiphilus sp.]|nr:hypothetical protein [Terracidiphilus sp.]
MAKRFTGATTINTLCVEMSSRKPIVPQLISAFDEQQNTFANRAWGQFCRAPAAVLLGALSIAWPAFYNGFPLMYPDTLDYTKAGRPVARALLLHRMSSYFGLRSLI